jgi:hypothetical protein
MDMVGDTDGQGGGAGTQVDGRETGTQTNGDKNDDNNNLLLQHQHV